jgi:hypothetical protein
VGRPKGKPGPEARAVELAGGRAEVLEWEGVVARVQARRQALQQAQQQPTPWQVMGAEALARVAAHAQARAVALAEAHAVALAGKVVVAQQQGEKEVVVVDP